MLINPSVKPSVCLFTVKKNRGNPLALICLVASYPAWQASSSAEDDASCVGVLASSAWVLRWAASCLLNVTVGEYTALGTEFWQQLYIKSHYTAFKSQDQWPDWGHALHQITSVTWRCCFSTNTHHLILKMFHNVHVNVGETVQNERQGTINV